MEITGRHVALGAGVAVATAAGVAGARFGFGIKTAVTQGGSPWGGTVNWYLARRGVIRFGVAQALKGNLPEALTMMKAEKTVRVMENQVFYNGAKQVGKKMHIGYDNGPDAFRHTGGSALIVYRLMNRHGLDADEALKFLKAAGNAHERDSFLHVYDAKHARFSSEMDVFNNNVGAAVAQSLATRHAHMGAEEIARMAETRMRELPAPIQDALRALDPGERVLLADVLRGIEEGRSVTMTPVPGVAYHDPVLRPNAPKGIHQAPHPSSAADIYSIAANGDKQVRTMAPHAAGYPQPFRDGRYVPGAERVPMNLKQLLKPRPEAPQA